MAQAKADKRARRPKTAKLAAYQPLHDYVTGKLGGAEHWSPDLVRAAHLTRCTTDTRSRSRSHCQSGTAACGPAFLDHVYECKQIRSQRSGTTSVAAQSTDQQCSAALPNDVELILIELVELHERGALRSGGGFVPGLDLAEQGGPHPDEDCRIPLA